MLNTAKTSVAF